MWDDEFEFPENSHLISGVCHISVSTSSQLNKPVIVQLEHCANITDKNQAQYLSFVVAKSGPPFKFEYLPGGSFCPGLHYGTIHLKEFSYLAIVLRTVVGGAIFGLGNVVLGGATSSAILCLGLVLGGAVGGTILGPGGILTDSVGGATLSIAGVVLGGVVCSAIRHHFATSKNILMYVWNKMFRTVLVSQQLYAY